MAERAAIKLLKVRFRDGESFLAHGLAGYDASFTHGGIFIRTRRAIPVGEPVVVEVRIGNYQSPNLVRGTVARSCPGKRSLKIKAGIAAEATP